MMSKFVKYNLLLLMSTGIAQGVSDETWAHIRRNRWRYASAGSCVALCGVARYNGYSKKEIANAATTGFLAGFFLGIPFVTKVYTPEDVAANCRAAHQEKLAQITRSAEQAEKAPAVVRQYLTEKAENEMSEFKREDQLIDSKIREEQEKNSAKIAKNEQIFLTSISIGMPTVMGLSLCTKYGIFNLFD